MLEVEKYFPVVYLVLRRNGLPEDEFLDAGLEELYKACQRFDPTKTKCAPQTYLIYNVERRIGMEIEKKAVWDGLIKKENNHHPLWFISSYRLLKNAATDLAIYSDNENNIIWKSDLEAREDDETKLYVDLFYRDFLDDRERLICKMREEGYSYIDIGKRLGCSKQNVEFIIRKIKKKMLNYFGEDACKDRKMKGKRGKE